MKHISIVLLMALTLASCGSEKTTQELIAEGDNKAISEKKVELLNQKKELETQIGSIEAYLEENTVKKAGALVSVEAVRDTLFNHYIELQGSVDTKKNITLMPEVPGVLTNVYVTEGQQVKKGQRLARIDDGGMAQQLEEMKVRAALAKTTFERQKNLWEQNIGSEIQYLQAQTAYKSQQSAIAAMQQQLGKTIVKAPFSGVIDDVMTEQGSNVSPGATMLMRLVNLDDMYIEVEVPETYIATVDEGTEVQVAFPVLGKTTTSKVRQSSAFINPANRSFKIEVPVKNTDGKVKPNLTARLRINDYTKENAILIPAAVINENQDGEQYVMVADGMEQGGEYDSAFAKARVIQTGKTTEAMVEVTSGLEKGDLIIVEGARTVKEGQQVRIMKN